MRFNQPPLPPQMQNDPARVPPSPEDANPNGKGCWIALGLCGIVLFLTCLGFWSQFWRVTTSAESPDGSHRAVLIDAHGFIDRNFWIRIDSTESWKSRTVFRSPDEGLPRGTERFIWSTDSKYVLLVGKHFFRVEPKLVTSQGEEAYLLIRVADDKLWWNIRDNKPSEKFTRDTLRQVGIAEEFEEVSE